MTEFDKRYLELVKEILNKGILVQNRTGIDTVKIPGYSFSFDVQKEFPILTCKQTFYKNAIIEMLWIWQMQSNDVRDLTSRGVKIWNEWMIDEDGIYRVYEQGKNAPNDPDREVVVLDPLSVPLDNPNAELSPRYDENGKVMMAKSLIPGKTIRYAKYYGKENAYTIGKAYGYITNRYKHTQNLIRTLINNPTDRRMVKSLWQDEFLREAVLPSCVWATEWDVTDGRINLHVHQRSCDVPLGLPFNVTQYATLLKMIAQVTNLEPGRVYYSIKDAHIYVDQLDGINELLRRNKVYNSLQRSSLADIVAFKKYYEEIIKYMKKEDKAYNIADSNIKMADMLLDAVNPELILDPSIHDFFAFDNSKELKHIKVKSYKHMGKINFPIAQ